MNNVVALATRSLHITLHITDPEVIHELERREDGSARDSFARHALRLGVLALQQANGALDADVIRREGDQLLASVNAVLQQRTSELSGSLAQTMLKYLDPTSGALPQRIDRLMQPNGELDALLAKHIDGDQSAIARTLARHIGEQSPLFKLLSPTQSDGLMAVLTDTIQKALDNQRDEVLKQFSLDRKDSALSRLLSEVSATNGKLRSDLAADVGKVVKELSLDAEGSAMQRLSSLLTKTNRAVESSLTLDDDASPLARLKREILGVLAQHKDATTQFQAEVRSTLDAFKVRREEAARSTQHGVTFEARVAEVLDQEAARAGDVGEHVGAVPGRLQRKFGDYVLELGPESASPGARVVFEAKARKRYTLKHALEELAEARKNRESEIGVCVFDRESAPENMASLHRIGCDVLVVWDAEDATSDVYLRAAYGLARALAHRERAVEAKAEEELAALDGLVEAFEAHVVTLASVEKSARSVRKHGESILASVESMRSALDRDVAALRTRVESVRGACAT